MRTHKIIIGLVSTLFMLTTAVSAPILVSAATDPTATPITCDVTNPDGTKTAMDCNSSAVQDQAAQGGNCKSVANCDLVSRYINPLITFMSVLVGLVVVASIIIGGIQYSSSSGNPQAAAAARKRITNAIIALVAYVLLVAVLNFIVPGGLL